jgi:hypothetical protein
MSAMERYDEKTGYPINQRLKEFFDQKEIDDLKGEIASSPGLAGIFERFCKLRTQIQALNRELLLLNDHRDAIHVILIEQQKKGFSKSQRREIMRWVNELVSAREPLVSDQEPLTDYDLKGADFGWVVSPFELVEEEKKLHQLDILHAATRHAAVKLLKAIQRQLGERMGDEEFEQKEEAFGP